MGNGKAFVKKNFKGTILFLGLDGAGKASIWEKLKISSAAKSVSSSFGTVITEFTYKNSTLASLDMGGRTVSLDTHTLLHCYGSSIKGVVLVVDGSDKVRMDELSLFTSQYYQKIEELQTVPLLVFLNKMDILSSLSPVEAIDRLKLHSLKLKCFQVQQCCASTGDGLYEGFEWLSEASC